MLSKFLCISLVSFFMYDILRNNIGDLIPVSGTSMIPTLDKKGNVLWLNVLFEYKNLKRGDLVVFDLPYKTSTSALKRIIGLPGDQITYENDGKKKQLTVPWSKVWVEGDNADSSTDSRYYGPVPLSLIKGIVTYRIFPFSKMGKIPKREKYGLNKLDENNMIISDE
eukprot:TRINITY_DN7319_c4_g1_i1.p1 TRINITY_DN7319_c4_g1~~TRINITY_DN7319_c4_g1_i1.p1  ORF type:complete len:167 (-),score=31.63 TRINITY_DN7319_c4_g1_i1:196-696(-)